MFNSSRDSISIVCFTLLACMSLTVLGHVNETIHNYRLAKRQITVCTTASCLNGGTCVSVGVNLGYCACLTGYTGYNCGTLLATTTAATATVTISLCTPGICQNGGTCNQLGQNLAICTCVTGYTGVFCNIPPSYATATAATISYPTFFPVTLTTGTTGPTSTTTATSTTTTVSYLSCDASVAGICQNGGTCLFNVNGVFCQCATTWSGAFCTERVQFCSTSPCRNGGTCVQNSFDIFGTCSCPSGYGGTLCEVGLTCNPNPCRNNNQCVTVNGLAYW